MNSPENPSRPQARDLFLKALEKHSPVERAVFLGDACAGDVGLRKAVEELLAHDHGNGCLENPAMSLPTVLLSPTERTGERIGRYKLLQQIGEGGFGTVWMAEQVEPVTRRVALKIIKLGMDTREVIARFEAERQALAMMDHPNIAKVFDAGATDNGRPFFVMELIRGIKITAYCDHANLRTEERLALFIQTCHAIQHAHEKGIIHRDIKPSNVLVTLLDGVPVPKVIDFGVAKATQSQRLTDLTLFTQFEQMIGTPLYMSPEQAELSGLDIDTRSDIYSLGILLYELLTGRTPFDPEELMRKGYDEIRRAIREQEPQAPSRFLKTMADETRATVAKHRQSDPIKLTRAVRGDLDWIVMKTIEKDRRRRYETSNGLAKDIERHLAHEPIAARPPSSAYRFRKLIRRNKLAFTAAAVGIIIAVAAAGGASRIIKGRLIDPATLRGEEAWVLIERERNAALAAADWPTLLNWCVVTDDRFQNQETDPVIQNFYKEKRGQVLAHAHTAVKGLLANLAAGWQPPPPEEDAFKKLRQNLEVVARLEGIPQERLLVLAKLDMPYLTSRNNSGTALRIYSDTIAEAPEFIPQLKTELSLTIQGMLDDFLADHAVDNREALTVQLQKLPEAACDSAPRVRLLLNILKAEAARSAHAKVESFATALNAVNEPATHPRMSAAYHADPEWGRILRREVDRLLSTIQSHPQLILALKDVLAATAEQWKTEQPYMMLAGAAELTQQKLDFYKAAERLTGHAEARARVAGYYITQAEALLKSGRGPQARRLLEDAMPRIEETAAGEEPEGMILLSEVLRKGLSGEKNPDQAIAWAFKAREKGHPNANFTLGLCYLEKAGESEDEALLKQAEAAFLAATKQEASPNAPRAWYFLANTYSLLKDLPALVGALEQGVQRQDPDSLYLLGQCLMTGNPYYKTSNLTLGRDHITTAARLGHDRAEEYLKSNARIWENSGLPADRDWLMRNAELLTK